MAAPVQTAKVVLDEEALRRTLVRIAHEIVERNADLDRVALVGIHARGVPLAQRLAGLIEQFEGVRLPVGELDVTMYRDDLELRGTRPEIHRSSMPFDVTDKRVVLVDDVLTTGATANAASRALLRGGAASVDVLAFARVVADG